MKYCIMVKNPRVSDRLSSFGLSHRMVMEDETAPRVMFDTSQRVTLPWLMSLARSFSVTLDVRGEHWCNIWLDERESP